MKKSLLLSLVFLCSVTFQAFSLDPGTEIGNSLTDDYRSYLLHKQDVIDVFEEVYKNCGRSYDGRHPEFNTLDDLLCFSKQLDLESDAPYIPLAYSVCLKYNSNLVLARACDLGHKEAQLYSEQKIKYLRETLEDLQKENATRDKCEKVLKELETAKIQDLHEDFVAQKKEIEALCEYENELRAQLEDLLKL